ncbi:23S rRNA (pseudouridine(1915)-N(3))-methyltransferase RlmH [Patescibacteria group bacterium]|nr:23S rRNA (pseudouridine(1915)-N(3))-methyltransferase RlmH [Patescibacteria group bacterium]
MPLGKKVFGKLEFKILLEQIYRAIMILGGRKYHY